ncbi:MAG: GntR family transcriptional regulator [Betaproteobacteria bacterium]|nr:GntR family transcriptional regulator [Betaproteobacteria bacterium]
MNATRKRSAAKRRAPVKQASANAQPRYLQIARELKRGIANGTYPLGARLPTELELCEKFGISRFTARGAVRVLSSAGLVTRRQRVGTVVVATPDDARYSHDAASLRDLSQYAQDTELRLVYVGRVALSKAQAREFGAEAGAEWIYAVGIRYQGATDAKINGKAARPFCLTRLYLNPVLKGIEAKLRERKTAVYALIEREYRIPIERVEQDLQGVVLDAGDAANLGATAGAPALRIVRRYYSGDGKLLEVADNVHPSERFTYHMQLRK